MVGNELGITPTIIRGEELKQKGFGGNLSHLVCSADSAVFLTYAKRDELAFSSRVNRYYL